jgi:stage V sporulation protein D (sporulation-specific penicillin-binding protein)
MNYPTQYQTVKKARVNHVQVLRILLILFGAVLIGRLFYVQIIRHDYYEAQALAEHTKKFEINAPRGIINMEDGTQTVPVVLNEVRYTIFADPQYIADASGTADKLIEVIGGEKEALVEKLSATNTRYVVLAKKFTKEQAERVDALELKGIGKKEVHIRTYPQDDLAAQLLGFVNDDGVGQYGVEGYENDLLTGEAGLEKAVTDVRGIPLAVSNDNILKQAIPGEDLTLTIDIGMQKLVENTLESAITRTNAAKGNIVLMEAKTGAIKAMANYPSYSPSSYDQITDMSLFMNSSVNSVWEPGSVMKPLLLGAAFTQGSLTPDTSYWEPGYVQVDDRRITNAFNYGEQTMTVRDIINKSLNTGAVFILKSLGGGEINQQARSIWYSYLTEHYLFNQLTGVEQIGEVTGYINPPDEGDGLNVRYANMAFGQGISLTPIQLVAAYNALLNGGTYYQPTLIANTDANGQLTTQQPIIKSEAIVSSEASALIKGMTKDALEINYPWAMRAGYTLGGKSGTAQVADGQGGYKEDLYYGTYIGYIASANGDIKYIMLVRLDEPKTGALASYEACKVWAELAGKLIDNFAIPS